MVTALPLAMCASSSITWLSATPVRLMSGAPRLGQDTREVLREAGLADAEIDALVRTGAAREAKTAQP